MTEANAKQPQQPESWVPVEAPHGDMRGYMTDRGSRCLIVLSSVVGDPDGNWWYYVSIGRVRSFADRRFMAPTASDVLYVRKGFDMADAMETTEEGSPARDLWLPYEHDDICIVCGEVIPIHHERTGSDAGQVCMSCEGTKPDEEE